jgi:hypothetical protein
MVDVRPGQVYVPGINAKNARALLAAAAKAGLNPKLAVRATEGGFVVPEQIAPKPSKTARILPVDPPPEPATPSPTARRGRKKSTKEG